MKYKCKILAVFLVAATLVLAGCEDKNSVSGKGNYVKFLETQFSAIAENLKGIKTSFENFSEDQLSKDKWVSDVQGKLVDIDKATSNIVSYDAVPDDFSEFHNKLKEDAYNLKNITNAYRTGIEKKDFNLLESANNQMESLAAALKTRVEDLKGMLQPGK